MLFPHAQIRITARLKTSGPGRKQPCIMLPVFNQNSQLCPVESLKEYIQRTTSLHSGKQLFVSFNAPYKPVTTQTISRWLREVLQLAHIDVSQFKGQSFRHASTSKAFAEGVNIDVIYNTAGWSAGSSVFARHYNRPIDNRDTFALSVLK